MGLFGKSFEEEVEEALQTIQGMGFDAWDLAARVDDKNVTLTGNARSIEMKTLIMMEFNKLVETENTLNMIRVAEKVHKKPEPEPTIKVEIPAEAGAHEDPTTDQLYEVVSGDTLGAISKRFYGKASLYKKIFEANRDILDNPDLIKVGQKLRIPPKE